MKICGIDPGKTGAFAFVDTETGELEIVDMPVEFRLMKDREKTVPDVRAIYTLMSEQKPDLVMLEHVEARPFGGNRNRGAASTWTFAEGFGALMASVQLALDGPRTHLVRPSIWKNALGVTSDKETSLALARQQFPAAQDMLKRKKDNDRAEALLLVTYFRRELEAGGEVEVI